MCLVRRHPSLSGDWELVLIKKREQRRNQRKREKYFGIGYCDSEAVVELKMSEREGFDTSWVIDRGAITFNGA